MDKISTIAYELGQIKCQTEVESNIGFGHNCLNIEIFAQPYSYRDIENDGKLLEYANKFACELVEPVDNHADPFWTCAERVAIECAIIQLVEQKGVANKELLKEYFQIPVKEGKTISEIYQDNLRDYILKNKETLCTLQIQNLLMIPSKTMGSVLTSTLVALN